MPIATGEKHFHFIVSLWGRSYSQLFVDICLPMLMTPGNLGICATRKHDRFVVATTWEDWQFIRESKAMKRLQGMMTVDCILIDGLVDLTGVKYKVTTACCEMAMRQPCVEPYLTHFVYLVPDGFWSDGTVRRLVELVAEGYKVAVGCGLRVNKEDAARELAARIEAHPDNPAMTLPEMVNFTLDHLHQFSRAFDWLGRGFINAWPSHIYWINYQDRQLIAHGFHLQPVMVMALPKMPPVGDSIDGEFMKRLPYPLSSYYIAQNDFFAIDLTVTDNSGAGQPLLTPSFEGMKDFLLFYVDKMHWSFFPYRITLNGNPERPILPVLEAMATEVVARILKYRRRAIALQSIGLYGYPRKRDEFDKKLYVMRSSMTAVIRKCSAPMRTCFSLLKRAVRKCLSLLKRIARRLWIKLNN